METISFFLLILLSGYLGTGFFVRKISDRNYIPTGIEYLLLGVLLSPALYGLLTGLTTFLPPFPINSDILSKLDPIISGVTGFLGLYWGMRFNLVDLLRSNREHFRIAIYDLFLGLVISGSAAFLLGYYLFRDAAPLDQIIFAAIFTGVMTGISSPRILNVLRKKYELKGTLTNSMASAAGISGSLAILIFGLSFPVYHILNRPELTLTATEFVTLSIGISVALGILFIIFIGRENDEHKIIAGVLGITLLGSGVAYYLGLSPLFLCFILGIFLGNISGMRSGIVAALHGMIPPLSAVTVIFAGISWVLPSDWLVWVAAFAFPAIKLFSKSITHRISFAAAFDKECVHPGQSGVFLVNDILVFSMLINYATVFNNLLLPFVMNTVFVVVIVFSLSSSWFTRKFLIESGEIE